MQAYSQVSNQKARAVSILIEGRPVTTKYRKMGRTLVDLDEAEISRFEQSEEEDDPRLFDLGWLKELEAEKNKIARRGHCSSTDDDDADRGLYEKIAVMKNSADQRGKLLKGRNWNGSTETDKKESDRIEIDSDEDVGLDVKTEMLKDLDNEQRHHSNKGKGKTSTEIDKEDWERFEIDSDVDVGMNEKSGSGNGSTEIDIDDSETIKIESDDDLRLNEEKEGNNDLLDQKPQHSKTGTGKGSTQGKSRGNVITPAVGMMFKDTDTLSTMYKDYAHAEGFGVTTALSRNFKSGIEKTLGLKKNFDLICDAGGKPRHSSVGVMLRPSKKLGCQAGLKCAWCKKNMCYKITKVFLEHNHSLDPRSSRLHPSQRNFGIDETRKIKIMRDSGMKPFAIREVFATELGGMENLRFNERDMHNYIHKLRKEINTHDGAFMQSYFRRMRTINDSYYYEFDLGPKNRIRNVFWCDARSRCLYESFNDIICFDTTYVTNRYNMPFAPFVGVNHHGQTIVLGAALMTNETISGFKWVFQQFLRCMGDVHPKAILTDQAKAIRAAVASVFPQSHHRWCIWHILKKIPKKVKMKGKKDFMVQVSAILFESCSEAECDELWNDLLARYKLSSNEWLLSIYDEKKMWVPAYLRDIFWAGMSSTQRSEGVNGFFGRYIDRHTTLTEFMGKYDKALQSKALKEWEADFKSRTLEMPLLIGSPIEKHFAKAYTKKMFTLFQKELKKVIDVKVTGRIVHNDCADEVIYYLKGRNDIPWSKNIFVEHIVIYNLVTGLGTCTCNKFEASGIICRHLYVVFREEEVCELNETYTLERWRKGVLRRHTLVKSNCDVDHMKPVMKCYDNLLKEAKLVCEKACEDDGRTKVALECFSRCTAKLEKMKTLEDGLVHKPRLKVGTVGISYTEEVEVNNNVLHSNVEEVVPIAPEKVATVGRPRLKTRWISEIERINTRMHNKCKGKGKTNPKTGPKKQNNQLHTGSGVDVNGCPGATKKNVGANNCGTSLKVEGHTIPQTFGKPRPLAKEAQQTKANRTTYVGECSKMAQSNLCSGEGADPSMNQAMWDEDKHNTFAGELGSNITWLTNYMKTTTDPMDGRHLSDKGNDVFHIRSSLALNEGEQMHDFNIQNDGNTFNECRKIEWDKLNGCHETRAKRPKHMFNFI